VGVKTVSHARFKVNIATIYLPLILVVSVARGVSAQPSQDSCMPGSLPHGFELIDYGRQRNTWSNRDRFIYLTGFVDGQSHTYMSLQDDLPAERRSPLRQKTFTFYRTSTLLDVMTSLYSDPANTYIAHSSMIYIARDKLAGKDIESLLRNARQNDCGAVEVGR
jgi:hypothetical protein